MKKGDKLILLKNWPFDKPTEDVTFDGFTDDPKYRGFIHLKEYQQVIKTGWGEMKRICFRPDHILEKR